MLNQIKLNNFGPLARLYWPNLGPINLVIGENGTGKTFLRYLDTSSIVFIDEPESALHPVAVSKLLDIVAVLAGHGIQFFLASHSYFVVKKLFLIAQVQNLSIPVISAHDSQWKAANLKDGMPENTIIDESIRLYREEVGLVLT